MTTNLFPINNVADAVELISMHLLLLHAPVIPDANARKDAIVSNQEILGRI